MKDHPIEKLQKFFKSSFNKELGNELLKINENNTEILDFNKRCHYEPNKDT